ncbi:MAG: hypothetical protein JWP91_2280 [Fibrobacteres bacterium]|nr:hypothetical protein [Fibrobacterota bacterium]
MPIYIALLRGINVSGQKPVLMAELQKMFATLGFKGAKTFIQTGNVVFESPKADKDALGSRIETAIARKFGFDVPVIIRTLEDLEAIVEADPWRKKKLAETERVYISYLDKAPSQDAVKALEAVPGENDEFILRKTEVYILARGGYGNTVFSNALMEKKLKVRSTTRNLETSVKLIALAKTL